MGWYVKCINLNILECKYDSMGFKALADESINLNILECKCDF